MGGSQKSTHKTADLGAVGCSNPLSLRPRDTAAGILAEDDVVGDVSAADSAPKFAQTRTTSKQAIFGACILCVLA